MYKLDIDYIVDISSTRFSYIVDILDTVISIYKDIDINIMFNYIDAVNLQKYIKYDITTLYQILGLFKLDKQEYFKNHNTRTLMISNIPIKTDKIVASFNIDVNDNSSYILVNYFNPKTKKEFSYKQKVMITAHEIAHSIGANHTPNKLGTKYTIMNPFVPDTNNIILKFSDKTKKDIHKFLEKLNDK